MARLYTPFLSELGGVIGGGLQKRAEKELIESAYMGDDAALTKLSTVNPQAANQIKQEKTSKAQLKLQEKRYGEEKAFKEKKFKTEQEQYTAEAKIDAEDRQAEALKSEREYVNETMEESANLDTFEEAKAFVARRVSENPKLAEHAEDFALTQEMFDQNKKVYGKGDLAKSDPVQSSKILPGGLVQIVRKSGKTEVIDPEDKSRTSVEAAEERGAELQGLRSGERDAAKAAIKVSSDAFKSLSGTRKNIANIDEGLALLREGANTGVMDKYLPSLKAASIKLDSLQGRLGLDVVGSVTFGALSKGELDLAKDVAMPSGLQPKDLIGWFEERKAAQAKLAENLEEAALFLGTPGNTIADFIKSKKEDKKKTKDTETQEQAPSSAPKTGDVQGGYKFKGGDPSKPENWEQQ